MNGTLQTTLRKLRLSGLAQSLDVRLQEAAGHSLNHLEFLELLLQDELAVRGDRSARAFNVASGIVFTVNGAASAWIYRRSEASGSLVPVLAHSRRWGRAPTLKTRCHRGALSRPRYAS